MGDRSPWCSAYVRLGKSAVSHEASCVASVTRTVMTQFEGRKVFRQEASRNGTATRVKTLSRVEIQVSGNYF